MAEKLEDLNLPNAVITRIIKQAIPDNVFIGKEARTAIGRTASVFVLYVTSAATNVCKKHNRKTVTGQDVLDALSDLEFEEFVDILREQLESFRRSKKDGSAKSKGKKSSNDVETGPEQEQEQEQEADEEMEVEEEDDDVS